MRLYSGRSCLAKPRGRQRDRWREGEREVGRDWKKRGIGREGGREEREWGGKGEDREVKKER